MTLVVTHTTVTGATADPTALVDGPAWDENHTLVGAATPAQGGTGVANNTASTITISGSFGLTFTISAATSLTFPTTGTVATLAGTEELTGKTLNASVGKGTWTASGTWTLPAVTFAGTITAAAANYSGTITFGTGTITALTEDTAPEIAADFLLTYDNSATAFKKVKPINLSQGFSAHKNGTDQTGIVASTFTKITFTTELFDVGSYYDAANSKWTPPAGIVLVTAGVASLGVVANASTYVILYKNGTRFRDSISVPGGTNTSNGLAVIEQANGTDYYEIYIFTGSAGTATALGNPTSNSFFCGKIL